MHALLRDCYRHHPRLRRCRMTRWPLLLGIVAMFGLTGCEQILEWMYPEEEPPPPGGCERVWDPVCGRDGNTYANLCLAGEAGVRVAHGGACDQDGCFCDDVYRPVCDARGIEYPNICEARCAGVRHIERCENATAPGGDWGEGGGDGGRGDRRDRGDWGEGGGAGDDVCMCYLVHDPVCAPDGRRFTNDCFAECHGVTDYVSCGDDEGCYCPEVYDPVCTRDGQRFSNGCHARCAGVTHFVPCEDEPRR